MLIAAVPTSLMFSLYEAREEKTACALTRRVTMSIEGSDHRALCIEGNCTSIHFSKSTILIMLFYHLGDTSEKRISSAVLPTEPSSRSHSLRRARFLVMMMYPFLTDVVFACEEAFCFDEVPPG